jgi:lipopolysaccharide transport system ATP-binding protein
MSQVALRIEGISKRYRLGGLQPYKTLRDTLVDFVRGRPENHAQKPEFWALRDVSFELMQGEVLGIVGRNGAGKSTLLKLLSRITTPDSGRIEVHGRIGSLLEVGTGFHPELTGRENIYMNGILLGMNRREVQRKFDEIVDFSGVEEFLDTPVKRYSSGMRVRLGFAVAAHLEPDILVVDEVLAVGDADFQRKCLGRMNLVASEGRTVLYVSHQMDSIIGLCKRAIWLDQGQLKLDGSPEYVVKEYLGNGTDAGSTADLRDFKSRDGSGAAKLLSIEVSGENGATPSCGSPLSFRVKWQATGAARGTWVVRVVIRDQLDRVLTIFDNELSGDVLEAGGSEFEAVCSVDQMPLVPSFYYADVSIWSGRVRHDRVLRALVFEVLPGGFFESGAVMSPGIVCIDHDWKFRIGDGAMAG